MDARDFAAAVGHPRVIGQSVGVHMSTWHLVEVTTSNTTANPRLGSWELEATLDTRPSGPRDSRFPIGPTAHYAIGPNDRVRHVRIFKPGP